MPKWGRHDKKPNLAKAYPSAAAKERADPNPFLAPHTPPRTLPKDIRDLLHDDPAMADQLSARMTYLYDHYWANSRMQSRYYAPLLRERPEMTIPADYLKELAALIYDATTGNIRRVAECVGVSIVMIEQWLAADKDFRTAWNDAHLYGVARVEERVVARARSKDSRDRASALAATVILNAKAPQVYRPTAPLPPPDLPADFALTDADNVYLRLRSGELTAGPPADEIPLLPEGEMIDVEAVPVVMEDEA